MMNFWQTVRILSAMAGLALLYLAASTSDYYVLELGQHEPSGVGKLIIAGAIMVLPLIVHTLYDLYIEARVADAMARKELEKEEE